MAPRGGCRALDHPLLARAPPAARRDRGTFAATAKTTVYYNGACPVCDAGIAAQRRRLGADDRVEWIDVAADPAALGAIGADLEFVRERLHVADEAGRVRIGLEAFRALWAVTPGQGWLARAAGLPGLKRLLGWGYDAFAAALYRWNRRRGRW